MNDKPNKTVDIEHVYVGVKEMRDMFPRLRGLTSGFPRATGGDGGSRRPPSSREPWKGHHVALDYGARVRAAEASLCPTLRRGRRVARLSDAGVDATLARLGPLVHRAYDAGHGELLAGTAAVPGVAVNLAYRWPRGMRAHLDELRAGEQKWSRAPGGLACPHCASELRLPPGWDEAIDAAHVYCMKCRDGDGARYSWPADVWLGILNAEPEHVTAREAAALTGCRPRTVHEWARRGHVARVGTRNGVPTYALTDIKNRVKR